MKRTPFFLVMILLLVSYSCDEKIDIVKEKEAIMAVVEGQTASYYSRDFDQWSSYYVQDSTSFITTENPYGYNIISGWESIAENNKQAFNNKPSEIKEVKTPIFIKIYEETAWILFNTKYIRDDGIVGVDQTRTYFLEKQDGSWKIVYTNAIFAGPYTRSNNYATPAISYVKSLGKSVEEFAGYVGDQYKTTWNQAGGINALANNLMFYLRSATPFGEFKVLERDDNHIDISANKILSDLKAGPVFDVTYDEYLTYLRVMYERIADYLGVTYTQETTADGVLITVSNN